MKTTLRCLLLLSLLLAVPLPAQTDNWPPERQARVKKATADRLAYAASAEYNPYNTKLSDIRKAAYELLGQHKYPEAIAEAQKGLAMSKYDIDLLMALSSAYEDSGDTTNAGKVREQWMGMLDSILRSGNGRDFATAFEVLSVDEEYVVLRLLKLDVTNQSLVGHEGHEFDVMKVKNPKSGFEETIYFNVDLPKKWLDRQLAKPAG